MLQDTRSGKSRHARAIFLWLASADIGKISKDKNLPACFVILCKYGMESIKFIRRISEGGGIIGDGQVDDANMGIVFEYLVKLLCGKLKLIFLAGLIRVQAVSGTPKPGSGNRMAVSVKPCSRYI